MLTGSMLAEAYFAVVGEDYIKSYLWDEIADQIRRKIVSKIVDNYARDRAVDAAIDVLKHQSNRVWDRMTELDAMLGRAQDPAKVLDALQELNGLIGGMRTCVHVWKSMRADRLEHENDKPEPAPLDVVHSLLAVEPDAKAETTAAAADIPDCDIPF